MVGIPSGNEATDLATTGNHQRIFSWFIALRENLQESPIIGFS
jgi:hypothetical protein